LRASRAAAICGGFRAAELEGLMANRPTWKGVKLEDAGHYVWFTNRAEVLREMKAFLGTP
jgi:hypothetical protein